ncbi:MAG: hypothetical protein ABIP63_08910 [Thermoanaerobaculia bacterium]
MRWTAEIEEALADARAVVRIGYPWWLRPWLFRDVAGITLGRRIYLAAGIREDQLGAMVRHELAHVRQVAELGLIPFLWRYGSEYLRYRRRGLSRDQAYRAISFERDAFAAERGDSV